MGKHEPMTPKAIGKRIKAKGLQKLKFYCQMCQKQCRDDNGFKCHVGSEAHQRQLLLFAENPNKILDQYSSEFLHDFLQLLKTRFGTRRVAANMVYQEYIKDRHHQHMNSTRWFSLTGLCKYLGQKKICEVDETEKGLFITYIDKEDIASREQAAKKAKLEKDSEDKMRKIIQLQIEKAKAAEKPKEEVANPVEYKPSETTVKFSFKATKPTLKRLK
ncbi:DNA/RNA-binding protein KIN17 [Tetranychus urticae]|uniref:DNA/RNA-binding protein Kin17 WH-like domain-containing protein n=1 Tax=Tetranychus urticae TaxID=32264 RepID=T1KWS3_TETUR|nr:DNA/RNA-binding protein KIN17 [Tetranychus urticae]